jgi:hypothetical protein
VRRDPERGEAMIDGGESAVILTAVIGVRLLVPLLIWRYPLPGFLLAVFIDTVDEGLLTILGVRFSEEAYQSYDKALDIYFLAIAMLAMLRNWESRAAVQLGLFLFYFRLVGVVAFELSGWRALLVIFPNTFAPYFVFYELVRTWWQPSRLRLRHYLAAAALISVGFKLPHELWLHVLQLDVTELFREVVLRGRYDELTGEVIAYVVLASAALAAIPLVFLLMRKLAPAPAHPLRLAADPRHARTKRVDRQPLAPARPALAGNLAPCRPAHGDRRPGAPRHHHPDARPPAGRHRTHHPRYRAAPVRRQARLAWDLAARRVRPPLPLQPRARLCEPRRPARCAGPLCCA